MRITHNTRRCDMNEWINAKKILPNEDGDYFWRVRGCYFHVFPLLLNGFYEVSIHFLIWYE